MEKFFKKFMNSFIIGYQRNKYIYVLSTICILLGLVIGVVLSFTNENLGDYLSLSDKNYFSYLKGDADLGNIFTSLFGDVVFAILICVVCSIVSFTLPITFLYLCYQSSIMMISIASIVSNFGFSGVVNSIFLILPFNLLILIVLGLIVSNVYSFCSYNKKMNASIFNLTYDNCFIYRLLALVFVVVLICLIMSYFIPYCLKSIIIVNY